MPAVARRTVPRAEKGAVLLERLSVLIGGGDVNKGNYVYAGGRDGSHLAYFYARLFEDADMPLERESCVCGHDITEQCFVEHAPSKQLAVVGNCCIKLYVGAARTCVHCRAPHKNMLDSECASCRTRTLWLTVPMARNAEAKALGARFDWARRRWYARAHSKWCDRRGLSKLFQPVEVLMDDEDSD